MSKDTRVQVLEDIEDLADSLSLRDLPADVLEDLSLISDLARHTNLSGFLNNCHRERLTEIRRAND